MTVLTNFHVSRCINRGYASGRQENRWVCIYPELLLPIMQPFLTPSHQWQSTESKRFIATITTSNYAQIKNYVPRATENSRTRCSMQMTKMTLSRDEWSCQMLTGNYLPQTADLAGRSWPWPCCVIQTSSCHVTIHWLIDWLIEVNGSGSPIRSTCRQCSRKRVQQLKKT